MASGCQHSGWLAINFVVAVLALSLAGHSAHTQAASGSPSESQQRHATSESESESGFKFTLARPVGPGRALQVVVSVDASGAWASESELASLSESHWQGNIIRLGVITLAEWHHDSDDARVILPVTSLAVSLSSGGYGFFLPSISCCVSALIRVAWSESESSRSLW